MTVVVQDQPSVWVWLGPVLLFVGAMITLWVTNARADKREWNKWRRDTLIQLCSDAVAAAQEVIALCGSALDQQTNVSAQGNLNAASKAAARIGTTSEQLYLINANHLADVCNTVKSAAVAINLPASLLHTARINAGHRQEKELNRLNERGPWWNDKDEDGPTGLELTAKIGEIHQRIHKQIVAEDEERYCALRDHLEAARVRFIERGRIELKSTT